MQDHFLGFYESLQILFKNYLVCKSFRVIKMFNDLNRCSVKNKNARKNNLFIYYFFYFYFF